jgi:predicted AAA+ superfamily ATPase
LLDLSAQVVRRLSGIKVETSAVFNMATQFGGGKTHSLTALYHLANEGRKAKSWKGVDSILKKAQVAEVPSADVAVFVGTEFDVLTGRGGNGEPMRMTPWGEIAWQLGKEEAFSVVREHDQQKIAPSGDVIRKMLPQGPTLILMDEMLNYVSRGRNLGLRDQFFNFLQNLAEESRGRDNLVMCMSIPASELEMNPEDQRDQDSLKKLMDRTGKAIMMSAETEVAEIIRRRLLEWYGLPDDGRITAAAYADWAIEHAAELTGVDAESIHEKFRTAYPFHPSVISVFERKWQALPRFQRTRGILRLLALWISWAYKEEHRKAAKEPLITLGSAPLEDPTFRAAVFEQLGSDKLEVPVIADIAGKKDSHSIRLDKEASEFIRKARLHQKVATTIFFESNGGQSQGKSEASAPEIKTAVGEPDLILAEVDNVLEGLVNTCFYLSWDRNKYRFSLSPNLNQMLVARRGAVKPASIDERIKKEIENLFKVGSKDIDRRYFPVRSNDVPDRPELTLVVMGMDSPAVIQLQ